MSQQPFNRQIILDTETTGLLTSDGHRVIEIGGVEIVNRKITGSSFQEYVNPERKSDIKALEIHGIRNDFLVDKPLFKDIYEKFIDYIRGADLIIHNAGFDLSFLNFELKLIGHPQKIEDICTITDSLTLAKQNFPGAKNNLNALCTRLNVDNSNRKIHGALLDAQILAEVYLQMTIGQVSLELDITPETTNSNNQYSSNTSIDLLVIMATEQELVTHNEFINQFSGANCG